ncbi:tRNA pseudouridine(13) synthase TruD [archaeon]|nr:tRNA pseudouridine(13) synthase TruD [archaeon]
MNIPRPDGFKVDEVPGDYSRGECSHFTLLKRGWNTLDAVKLIAKKLKVSVKRFRVAGLKDKHAVTTQRVSAWRVPKKRLEGLDLKGIKILDIKEGLERISIGSHKGNKFRIVLEGVKELRKPVKVPNYFGKQRFGGNALLGKKLAESDWEGAVRLLNPRGSYERKVFSYLRKRPGDYLGALKRVDKKIRRLWVNAWQSKQWNQKLDTSKKTQELPSYKEITGMPELGSFPGNERETIMKVKDYKIKKLKKGVELDFTLPSGCYATTLIDYILKKH